MAALEEVRKLNLLSGLLSSLLTYQIIINIINTGDPPVAGFLSSLTIPFPNVPLNPASIDDQVVSDIPAGSLTALVQAPSINVSNQLTASWSSGATSSFLANSLNIGGASVKDANGDLIGSGPVALNAPNAIPLTVAGNVNYNVNGRGSLSFYAPTTTNLGVSGDWDNYTASLSGNVTLKLTSDALTLNGTPLPAGTYTITTASATLAGSGPSTSPNFAGSVSIDTTGDTVDLGPGTGNIAVGGKPLDPTNGVTMTGYTGSITVSANGNNTDSVTLNGNAANVLQVSGSPATLPTDQNTPVTFQTNVATSFADTYTLTAQAPPGWTVTIDNKGNVTATPAPVSRAARTRSRSSRNRRPIPTSSRRASST